MSHKDKVALVTGASRGIGRAIALALGKEDAFVIGTATTSEGADSISKAFKEANLKGCGIVLNVASQESIDTAIAWIKQHHAMPAILVNNAASPR